MESLHAAAGDVPTRDAADHNSLSISSLLLGGRRQFNQVWAEPARSNSPGGLRYRRQLLGTSDLGPAAYLIEFLPGQEGGPHSHPGDYIEVVVDGEIEVSGHLYKVGDFRIVRGGTPYGPLRSGPKGCTVLALFESTAAAENPRPVKPHDATTYSH